MHPKDHVALTAVLFVMLLALGAFAVVQQVQLTSLRQRVDRVESRPVAEPAAPVSLDSVKAAEAADARNIEELRDWRVTFLDDLAGWKSRMGENVAFIANHSNLFTPPAAASAPTTYPPPIYPFQPPFH